METAAKDRRGRACPFRTMTPLRTALITAAAALAVLVLGVAPASAAKPCWYQVQNDWYRHGQVQGSYPVHCYVEAIKKLPEDSKTYSSAPDDIRRAMLLAIRTERGGGPGGPSPGVTRSPSGSGSTGSGGRRLLRQRLRHLRTGERERGAGAADRARSGRAAPARGRRGQRRRPPGAVPPDRDRAPRTARRPRRVAQLRDRVRPSDAPTNFRRPPLRRARRHALAGT